jgi:IS1 family transposase
MAYWLPKIKLTAHWVRKLTVKPAFLTSADCECKARRIQGLVYDGDLPELAAESKACRIQSELDWPAARIASLICFASGGVNRAANCSPLAFCVPSFGLPTLFFIINVTKNIDGTVIYGNNYCNIKIDMANKLQFEKKVNVVSMLCEGSSIRAVERITGVNQNTIMSLGRRVGDACRTLADEKMRGLSSRHIEVDEIWGFIGAKRNNAARVGAYGDVWTFIALDAETKIIPSFVVGKRDAYHAREFMEDLARRMAHRIQVSADGLAAYPDAVERGFGSEVDFGVLVKTYAVTNLGNFKEAASRYSPAEVVSM